MEAFIAAGAGFLLAVLWFDLMHDVLARGADTVLPESDLETIARYYRRVTTDASPMGRLVAVVMLGTLIAAIVQLVAGSAPAWVAVVSIGLVVVPLVLVRVRTFPNAVRLGARTDDAAVQSDLARAILRDHVLCLAVMIALLSLQLATAIS